MKKITSLFLVVLMLLSMSVTVIGDTGVLSYSRIAVTMPELTVELKGTSHDTANLTATLGSESLALTDAHVYSKETDSVCAYILVDLSTSMRRSFDNVKQSIINYANQMGSNDKIVLITFGETITETELSGKQDKGEIAAHIQALECNEGGTLFYEVLNRAYQLANASISSFDREYVIAFSDGIDVQTGNTTFAEVSKLYGTHGLPLYAACTPNSSSDAEVATDLFGELARSSGGSLVMLTGVAEFDSLLASINDVTMLKLTASNNIVDGQERQLSVKIGASQVECNVPVTRSLADTTAPTVEEIKFDVDKNSFVVSFSEAVVGASEPGAYSITDAEGKSYSIEAVNASEQGKSAEIRMKDKLQNGEYTIVFDEIADYSQESNALEATETVTVDGVIEEKTEPEKEDITDKILLIVIIALVLIVLVIVIIIVATKNKKNQEASQNATSTEGAGSQTVINNSYQYETNVIEKSKHHIKVADVARIKMKIKTGNLSEQIIETNVVSSIIIGRSDTCDVFIDDTKLSRQHFVIENDNGRFYVMDLNSRNGTKLNGIRVGSRQELHNGDKIFAGLSDFIIHF